MVEHVRDQIINWKLDSVGHNPTAEQYLGMLQYNLPQRSPVEHRKPSSLIFQRKLKILTLLSHESFYESNKMSVL